jgi:mannose-6-phosphate isomerase-like protein (cupin superfamily)
MGLKLSSSGKARVNAARVNAAGVNMAGVNMAGVNMTGVNMTKTEVFALDELLAKRLQAGRSYLEFLRVPAMSAGVYVLPAGAPDPQQPHHQDEIYYVVRGKAKMRIAEEERSVAAGSVMFVGAGLEHRFFDVEEELVVLVVFAPEESG